jgi:hypothetical protein
MEDKKFLRPKLDTEYKGFSPSAPYVVFYTASEDAVIYAAESMGVHIGAKIIKVCRNFLEASELAASLNNAKK